MSRLCTIYLKNLNVGIKTYCIRVVYDAFRGRSKNCCGRRRSTLRNLISSLQKQYCKLPEYRSRPALCVSTAYSTLALNQTALTYIISRSRAAHDVADMHTYAVQMLMDVRGVDNIILIFLSHLPEKKSNLPIYLPSLGVVWLFRNRNRLPYLL